MRANKSRACFTNYVHTTACGAHKLIHRCHEIHIFPCRAAARSLWMLWLWHSILFSRWVECSIGLELESRTVGRDRMPSRNCLYSKPPWLMQPLFSSPFSLSPQLLPSITHEIPASLATSRTLPPLSSSSSSRFPLLSLECPPTLRRRISIPGRPGVRDVHCHNSSAWQTSHHVLVATQQCCTGITMNDLTA